MEMGVNSREIVELHHCTFLRRRKLFFIDKEGSKGGK